MKMPFGKFTGVQVADLPDDYLTWLHDLADLHEPLKSAVLTEFALRFTKPSAKTALPSNVRTMALELVSAGFRKLAMQHHPDHGGETRTMQLVNRAADFLRQAARRAT